jgi:hypothetical protein
MITLTLLDVDNVLGLSIMGSEATSSHTFECKELGIIFTQILVVDSLSNTDILS